MSDEKKKKSREAVQKWRSLKRLNDLKKDSIILEYKSQIDVLQSEREGDQNEIHLLKQQLQNLERENQKFHEKERINHNISKRKKILSKPL